MGRTGSQSDPGGLAFAETALAHLDALYRYAVSLTHNPAEAEDLVQECYLRACRSCAQLAPDSNVKSWMFTILRNAWINQLRHKRSGPQFMKTESDSDLGPALEVTGGEDPYAVYVHRLERDAVRQAVNQLPQPYREVIVLREFEDLSYQEISEILLLPPGTVMSRLGRARDKLRLALSQWGRASAALN